MTQPKDQLGHYAENKEMSYFYIYKNCLSPQDHSLLRPNTGWLHSITKIIPKLTQTLDYFVKDSGGLYLKLFCIDLLLTFWLQANAVVN